MLGANRMKKMIIISVVIIMVLSLVSPVLAAPPPNKPITPPELKQITIIHYAKPESPPGKAKKDNEPPPPDNGVYVLLGPKLIETALYYINPTSAPDGAVAEINEAFEAWDAVTDAELFNYVDTTTRIGINLDGQNTVSWIRILPRNIIGVASYWTEEKEGKTAIVEFDIAFNAFLKWGVDPDDEGPIELKRAYDVENIAIHEAGHALGLADLYGETHYELTMYGYSSTGETQKISLEAGDIAGAQHLYGIPAP